MEHLEIHFPKHPSPISGCGTLYHQFFSVKTASSQKPHLSGMLPQYAAETHVFNFHHILLELTQGNSSALASHSPITSLPPMAANTK